LQKRYGNCKIGCDILSTFARE